MSLHCPVRLRLPGTGGQGALVVNPAALEIVPAQCGRAPGACQARLLRAWRGPTGLSGV